MEILHAFIGDLSVQNNQRREALQQAKFLHGSVCQGDVSQAKSFQTPEFLQFL